MSKTIVLALTGPDRIGFVDEIAGLVFVRGGNVDASRMSRLGGEFAMLMQVSLPAESMGGLADDLDRLEARGYRASIKTIESAELAERPGWLAYEIDVQGADHEGIIHEVAHYLSAQGINIEEADSQCTPGATSGVPLFSMTAQVLVPPSLHGTGWHEGLAQIGDRLNLDIRVRSEEGRAP